MYQIEKEIEKIPELKIGRVLSNKFAVVSDLYTNGEWSPSAFVMGIDGKGNVAEYGKFTVESLKWIRENDINCPAIVRDIKTVRDNGKIKHIAVNVDNRKYRKTQRKLYVLLKPLENKMFSSLRKALYPYKFVN